MERKIRSSGPPEEVVEDSVQSWEGQPSVMPAIKGISTSSGKAVRNWERLSRDPEAIATAGIVRVMDRDVETSSTSPDITSISYAGVVTGKAAEVPMVSEL